MAIVLIGLFRKGEKSAAFSWFVSSPDIFPPFQKAALEYGILFFSMLVWCVAVMALNGYLINPYWGESGFFLGRIDLARLGYRPYIDFQFPYGPALLYLPIFLDKVTGGYFGSENTYAASVVLGYAFGFVLLFIFVRFLSLPDQDRPWVLALTIIIWSCLTLGLQYTPTRYAVLPCAVALGGVALLPSTKQKTTAFMARATVIVGACCLLCYAVSPEIGIACTVGFAACAAVHFWAQRMPSAVACLLGICLSFALVMRLSEGYFISVFGFGIGARNFPFYPSFANITLVAASLYILPKMAYAVIREPASNTAPLAASLGAAAATLLPAAMGRCDPGHVLLNGLTLFIIPFAAFGHVSRKFLVRWGVYFGFVFFVLAHFSYWGHYWGKWRQAYADHTYYISHPEVFNKWAAEWKKEGAKSPNYALLNWHKVAPFPDVSDAVLNTSDRITAPLGGEAGLDRFLKIRPNYHPEYYPTYQAETNTPQDVRRLVEETKTNYDSMLIAVPDLLHARDDMNNPPRYQRYGFLSRLLVFPVLTALRNPPYFPQDEIAKALLLKDSPVVRNGEDFVLVKTPR